MRQFGRLIIGGIQNKIFNLVLINIIIIVIAYTVVIYHSANDLQDLVAETNAKQEESMRNITQNTMHSVVNSSMGQSTVMEAYIANNLFSTLRDKVQMLGDYAEKLLTEADYPDIEVLPPSRTMDGIVVSQLIYGENTDINDPLVKKKLNLLGNLSDMMCSLYNTSNINSCFVSVPEGFTIIADDRSSTKLDENGKAVRIDGPARGWYKGAVDAGDIYFSDIEIDAFTGKKGLVCALPIYVNGELQAVVGADLFLDSIDSGIESVSQNGSVVFIVNENGHVIFSPQNQTIFKVNVSSEAVDLRSSDNSELSSFINDSLNGNTSVREVSLDGKVYYMSGAPMSTVGWAIISAIEKDLCMQPAEMIADNNKQILDNASETYEYKLKKSKQTILVLLGVILVVGIINAMVLAKKIVKPLNHMATRVNEIGGEDLQFKMEDIYKTKDEIQVLAENFEALSIKTLNYIEQVKQITTEKERIGAELNVATQIQADMLPRIFPPFPERKEFDLYASMNPAKEVGGDFYDYFLIDDDHIALVMADVSGKGVPAALFMVITKTLLKNRAQMGDTPSEILADVNNQLCEGNEAELFCTVWLAIIEISTGKGVAANAGHEHPALCHKDGEYELVTYKHSPALAVMEGIPFRQHDFELKPGDTLFVYTDGVTEATDSKNELFGEAGLLKSLNRDIEAEPKQVIENVNDGILDFIEDAPQFDDITMLCFKYFGADGEGSVQTLKEAV